MTIQEVLKYADELVQLKTGSHLTSLQQAVLAGVWNHKKYKDIASEYHCSEANVKRVAVDLWKLLSAELGEPVKKSNFRATIERYYIQKSHINNFVQTNLNHGSINVCSETLASHPNIYPENYPRKTTDKEHDLSQAPDLHTIYGRTEELDIMQRWVVENNSSLILITGLSGIGKTAIARHLVEKIKDQFDYVLWRSHRQLTSFNALEQDILTFFSQDKDFENTTIIKQFMKNRCLIILDDLQDILMPSKLVGSYREEYEQYGQFLKDIGQSTHQSCLILMSWEKPTAISTLEAQKYPCHTLQICGLGESAIELLETHSLRDKEQWLDLIDYYDGNPSWLNLIAATIQDIFNGSVASFLEYETLVVGDIVPMISDHYRRLSESEKEVLLWLAHQEEPVLLSQYSRKQLSKFDFVEAVQSLRKRGLIDKKSLTTDSGFILKPLIKEYVRRQKNLGS